MIIVTSSFSKRLDSNFSGLKSAFEKLHFRDGLVWTVYLTLEIMLRFQIPSALSGRGLSTAPLLDWVIRVVMCAYLALQVCSSLSCQPYG